MRICMVTLDNPYLHRKDGVAVHTYFLSVNLARLGCEVHVLGLSRDLEVKKVFHQDGVTYHCLPIFKRIDEPLKLLLFFKGMAKEILMLSRRVRFDVVHGQGSYAGAVALAKRAGLKSKCVATIHTVGFDEQINIARDNWKSGFYLAGLRTLLSALPPVIVLYGNLVYNQMDVNISTSEYNRRRASRIYGVPLEKIITIPSGVDESRFINVRCKHANSSVAEHPLLLYVGRLVPRKGIQYLLRAMPQIIEDFPMARLVIVGEGPLRRYLENLSRKLGIQRSVLFLGYVSFAEVSRFYITADAVVIPSLFEGLPLVLLEAMAAGKPVVASAVQGIPEVIRHGFSGLLVKPGDAHGIVRAVKIILQDRKFAHYLAENARLTALREYGWKKIAERTIEVYGKI